MTDGRTIDDCVAESLDAESPLLPWIPELLADLEDLGGDSTEIVRAFEALGLERDHVVIDLGCGKGATSIALARRFGCRVDGIDGLATFVEHARAAARSADVADLCRFEHADARQAVCRGVQYDAALWLGTGDALGDLAATVGSLRRAVRPGGWIAIEESFAAHPDERSLPGLEETRRLLRSTGDDIALELLPDPEALEQRNRDNSTAIEARARALGRRRPDLAALFEAYAATQWRETEAMAGRVGCGLWILSRTPDRGGKERNPSPIRGS